MEKILADTGGRPAYNDDLLLVQKSLTDIVDSLIFPIAAINPGNAIILNGLNLVPKPGGLVDISSGLVYFCGDGLPGGFATFEGATGVTLPAFLIQSETVFVDIYENGTQSLISTRKVCVVTAIEPGTGPVPFERHLPVYDLNPGPARVTNFLNIPRQVPLDLNDIISTGSYIVVSGTGNAPVAFEGILECVFILGRGTQRFTTLSNNLSIAPPVPLVFVRGYSFFAAGVKFSAWTQL
jgi:hypothetical protein